MTATPKKLHLEILSLQLNEVKFLMTGTVLAVANAFRRAALAVPSMAIDETIVSENTSLWTDEYLGHRLQQIPFRSKDAGLFQMAATCECKSQCQKCAVVYKIDVCNNDGCEKIIPVTTRNLIHVPFHDETTTVQPLDYEIPILVVKLQQHQSLKAIVTIRKGIGKSDGKWEHCTVSMEEEPLVRLDEEMLNNLTIIQTQNLIDICPTKVFGYAKKKGKKHAVVCNSRACTECGECMTLTTDVWKLPSLVQIERLQNRFLFTVHTNGMLDAADVVAQALQSVQERESQILQDVFPLASLWKKIKPNV